MFRQASALSRVREIRALQGITIRISDGETYGLLGPNGSGKSTLIRILSTLLIADSGTVNVLGFDLPLQAHEVQRRIGRVSAEAAFYGRLSTRENLLFAGYLHGITGQEAEARSLEVLDRVGFDLKRFNEPLENLSRGTQQKVAIARCLLLRTRLLLLDEPTTGLDPQSKRDVHAILQEIRRLHGITILLTTHDLAEVEQLRCDRIGILSAGRLVAQGTVKELKVSAAESLEEAFLRVIAQGSP